MLCRLTNISRLRCTIRFILIMMNATDRTMMMTAMTVTNSIANLKKNAILLVSSSDLLMLSPLASKYCGIRSSLASLNSTNNRLLPFSSALPNSLLAHRKKSSGTRIELILPVKPTMRLL